MDERNGNGPVYWDSQTTNKWFNENAKEASTFEDLLEKVNLTEEEKKAFFEANKSKFNKPESASAKHILVDSEESANDILNKINSNEMTFEAAASAHSTCPSKDAGGDLGTFTRGQMVPEFEEAVFSMNNGEVTGPVKTQFGYHLIKLENRQAGGESEYEEVKHEIERSLMYQKQSEAYTNELNNLKSKYSETVKYHA